MLKIKSPSKTVALGVGHAVNIHHTPPANDTGYFCTVYENGTATDMTLSEYQEYSSKKHEAQRKADIKADRIDLLKCIFKGVAIGLSILLFFYFVF